MIKIDSIQICEYLRIYAKTLLLSIESDKTLYEAYEEIINNNETNLPLIDFNAMLLIKNYITTSNMLFYMRDAVNKGLNGVELLERGNFIDKNSELNKKCLENFTDKDIIFYTRNALAHNKNNLYEFLIDETNLKIHIKLENTVATKGPNIGDSIPFEIEFDNDGLIRIIDFCNHFSKNFTITGVDVDSEIWKKVSGRSIINMLKQIIDTTYYEYILFNQINDSTKKRLMEIYNDKESNKQEFEELKRRYAKKEDKIELSEAQKECIFNSMSDKIHRDLKNRRINLAMVRKFWNSTQIADLINTYFNELFEYEALKVIPMGREKFNNFIIAFLFTIYNRGTKTIKETQEELLNELKKESLVSSFFKNFHTDDKEELNMFQKTIQDTNYLKEEALVTYYRYVFENFSQDGQVAVRENNIYEFDTIRNAFTHGRWYFDEKNNNWELFDNSQSRDKPDQYIFDKHITIPADFLHTIAYTIFSNYADTQEKEKVKVKTN